MCICFEMGRRYYCEYCDKSFVETQDAVKKHRNGLVHQKALKEHYQQFKDIRSILMEESSKNPCNRFIKNGECSFGLTCRYSHYMKDQLDQMRWEVEQMQSSKGMNDATMNTPTLETWFCSRRQKNLKDSPALEEFFKQTLHTNNLNPYYSHQPIMNHVLDLPPSLKMPSGKEINDSQNSSWG